ncbi:MAG: methionine adenosyltransferase [Candidatus Nanoarchaeia archaeon]
MLITSESVTEGHPDKMCDKISDAILDACLREDPHSRVAVETSAKNGGVHVFGEITTKANVDITKVARKTIKDIGYVNAAYGIEHETCSVWTQLTGQSPDISQGVNVGEGLYKEQGAGDQGMMFGYATDETEDYLPLPIHLAHKLAKQLTALRKNKALNYLRPDGKTQVTVEYIDNRPVRVHTIVVSAQHDEDVSYPEFKKDIIEHVIRPVCGNWIDDSTIFHINPTGNFVRGGPYADAGLTGRKIIVDTYGGVGRHGGGAFSGKDPTKVDRSGAYAARYIAKNIVAAGLSKKCEVQLAYAIGVAKPVSVHIDCFGTEKVSVEKISKAVDQLFPLTPSKMRDTLRLVNTTYSDIAAYGHFGDNAKHKPWEQLEKVQQLQTLLSPLILES